MIDKSELQMALSDPVRYKSYLEHLFIKLENLSYEEILEYSICNGCKIENGS